MVMKIIQALVFSSAVFYAVSTLALSTDRDEPAVIEADDVEFDFRTGVRTYRGNVTVVQGTLQITSDKLIVNYKDGRMQNATAWGNPATFRQRPDGKDDDVIGKGKKILLDEEKNTLTLFTTASLKQGSDTALGDVIIYDMGKDKLRVKGAAPPPRDATIPERKGEKPKSRSRIIITPQSSSK